MKKIVYMLFACCLLCCGTGLAQQQKSPDEAQPGAQVKEVATRIVRIRGYEGVIPLNLFISPGTVVIWLNQYNGQVKIMFPDKKVTMACKSPVNFFVNDKGVFESRSVEFGAVASLCFVEQGSFEYSIGRNPPSARARSEGFRFEGKIVVK